MFNSRGFTLIEVLISMVVLSIGLLGLAAMQVISFRDNQDAYYYLQATLLAYEMQDRLHGNNVADWNSVAIGAGDCTKIAQCDAQTMANNDYGYWKRSAEAILPTPKTGEMVEISSLAQDNSACKKTYSTSLCLITRWGRTNDKDTGILSNDSTFYLEVTP